MKFTEGKTYVRPGLYGPSFRVKCVKIRDNKAYFVEVGWENEEPAVIEIETDESGMQRCLCWESQGHKSYIYPSSEGGTL